MELLGFFKEFSRLIHNFVCQIQYFQFVLRDLLSLPQHIKKLLLFYFNTKLNDF